LRDGHRGGKHLKSQQSTFRFPHGAKTGFEPRTAPCWFATDENRLDLRRINKRDHAERWRIAVKSESSRYRVADQFRGDARPF